MCGNAIVTWQYWDVLWEQLQLSLWANNCETQGVARKTRGFAKHADFLIESLPFGYYTLTEYTNTTWSKYHNTIQRPKHPHCHAHSTVSVMPTRQFQSHPLTGDFLLCPLISFCHTHSMGLAMPTQATPTHYFLSHPLTFIHTVDWDLGVGMSHHHPGQLLAYLRDVCHTQPLVT